MTHLMCYIERYRYSIRMLCVFRRKKRKNTLEFILIKLFYWKYHGAWIWHQRWGFHANRSMVHSLIEIVFAADFAARWWRRTPRKLFALKIPNACRTKIEIVNICVWNVDRLVRGLFSTLIPHPLRWGMWVLLIPIYIRPMQDAEPKKRWWEASDSISMQFAQKPWKIYYVTCYLLWHRVQYLLFKRGHWCSRHACIQLRTCFLEWASFVVNTAVTLLAPLFTRTESTSYRLYQQCSEWTLWEFEHEFSHDYSSRHNDKIAIRRCLESSIQTHSELQFNGERNRSRMNGFLILYYKHKNWTVENQPYHRTDDAIARLIFTSNLWLLKIYFDKRKVRYQIVDWIGIAFEFGLDLDLLNAIACIEQNIKHIRHYGIPRHMAVRKQYNHEQRTSEKKLDVSS